MGEEQEPKDNDEVAEEANIEEDDNENAGHNRVSDEESVESQESTGTTTRHRDRDPVVCRTRGQQESYMPVVHRTRGYTMIYHEMLLRQCEIEYKHNLMTIEDNQEVEYDNHEARFLAMLIKDINDHKNNEGLSFLQQYFFDKGIKVFGEERGKAAAIKEVQQQNTRKYFSPVAVHLLTKQEKENVHETLMYEVQKRTGEIKG